MENIIEAIVAVAVVLCLTGLLFFNMYFDNKELEYCTSNGYEQVLENNVKLWKKK